MILRSFVKACALIAFILLSACAKKKPYQYSFYYWKTGEHAYRDTAELKTIEQYGIEHFYVHYMDVDWSENLGIPIPVAQISGYNLSNFTNKAYTPVVFISNRTFARISQEWCDTLAQKIAGKIFEISGEIESSYINSEVHRLLANNAGNISGEAEDSLREKLRKERALLNNEIQIDCDWTAKTKEKYFYFLQRFKSLYKQKKISATIRLYPYKYPDKTGVPPVDKGLLMCYNLGNIQQAATDNSVFDLSTLKQYLSNKEYPLPLDVALPMFGWHAWFRADKFKGIIYETDAFNNMPASVFKKEDNTRYLVKADTVIQDKYLREGDVLRSEFPDASELLKAEKLLRSMIPNIGRLSIYHWNYPNIKNYESSIQQLFPPR